MSEVQQVGAGTVQAPTAQTGVFCLVYRSHSRMADADSRTGLADILRVSRANNAKCGVTGALMLYGTWFAQILEGPEDEVQRVFSRISADRRHDQVEIRQNGMVATRAFRGWAMANVGEHGQADTPTLAVTSGLAEGAPWKITSEQEPALAMLRGLTRGYV